MAYPVVVDVIWDDEAQVYSAHSDDVPGLVAECVSFEGLVSKVEALIPELIKLNGLRDCYAASELTVSFMAKRQERIRLSQ